MNDTINIRKQELQERVEELEESLVELKEQLAKEEEAEQHAAIDNLEMYFDKIDNKYENMRNFWSIAVTELREFFDDLTSNDKKEDRG